MNSLGSDAFDSSKMTAMHRSFCEVMYKKHYPSSSIPPRLDHLINTYMDIYNLVPVNTVPWVVAALKVPWLRSISVHPVPRLSECANEISKDSSTL